MQRAPLLLTVVVALATASAACDAGVGASSGLPIDSGALDADSDGVGDEPPDVAEPIGPAATDTSDDPDGTDAHMGPCDPVAQTGCGDDGTCTYLSLTDLEPVCVPSGTVPYGEACSTEAPCEHGICLALNDAAALCYRFCAPPVESSPEADAGETGCPDGAACLGLDNAQYRICEITGVYATCDLLDPVQCPEDQGCYRIASEADPVCLPAGTASDGETCDTANGCTPGQACVDTICTPLCDMDAASPCADDTASCEPYFDGGVGYCD